MPVFLAWAMGQRGSMIRGGNRNRRQALPGVEVVGVGGGERLQGSAGLLG